MSWFGDGEMNFDPSQPCSVCGRDSCHPSMHKANREEVDELAKRYCNPTRVLRALRVRAKWRYDQVQLYKRRRMQNNHDAIEPDACSSSDNISNSCFALEKGSFEDELLAVTAKCSWLEDKAIHKMRGCFIGFDGKNDLALIVLIDAPCDDGETCKLPLLCSSKYLPEEIKSRRSKFLQTAHDMNKYSHVIIERAHTRHVEKETDGGKKYIFVNGGLFQRQNRLICDNNLIRAINGGLALFKERGARKKDFRLAAKKDFWFQEKQQPYSKVLAVRMANNANEPLNVVLGRDNTYHEKVFRIAQLAKFQLAGRDIQGVSSFLDSIQEISNLVETPSLYDRCLLFALCQREEPEALGRIIPCKVRENYSNDSNGKTWTYGSTVCTCDLISDDMKLMKNFKRTKRESGNAHDEDKFRY